MFHPSLSSNWFFESNNSFIKKNDGHASKFPLCTYHTVIRPGFKTVSQSSNEQHILNRDLSRFMQSLRRVRQTDRASERNALDYEIRDKQLGSCLITLSLVVKLTRPHSSLSLLSLLTREALVW